MNTEATLAALLECLIKDFEHGLLEHPPAALPAHDRQLAIRGPQAMIIKSYHAGKIVHHKQIQQLYRGGTLGRKR